MLAAVERNARTGRYLQANERMMACFDSFSFFFLKLLDSHSRPLSTRLGDLLKAEKQHQNYTKAKEAKRYSLTQYFNFTSRPPLSLLPSNTSFVFVIFRSQFGKSTFVVQESDGGPRFIMNNKSLPHVANNQSLSPVKVISPSKARAGRGAVCEITGYYV